MEGVGGDSSDGESKKEAEVRVFMTSEDLSRALAEHVVDVSNAAIMKRGVFSLAFLGAENLVERLLRELDRPHFMQTEDWKKWYVFWPVDKLTKDSYLNKVDMVFKKVASLSINARTTQKAVEKYEYKLRQYVRTRMVKVFPSSDWPRFDLILLMLGTKNDVASLLPNNPEESAWVAPLSDDSDSVSFTLPVVNSAANLTIVVNGGTNVAECDPAQVINLSNGKLIWFADDSANASQRSVVSSGFI